MGVKISEMTELPVANLAEGDFTVIERDATDNFRVDLGAFTAALTGGALLASNNLSDLPNMATARANLGVFYGVGFFFTTTPTDSEVLALHVAMSNFTLAANFASSRGACGTNPTASFAIDVQKNGATIGTITIGTDGSFTFTTVGGTAKGIVAGDLLKFVAPGTADATCANVAITLKGAP